MKLRVEISLHPLTENFIPPIDNFINRLHDYKGVSVTTNELSTHVYGEYDQVMKLVGEEMKISFQTGTKMVFVSKFHCPEL